MRCFDQAMIRVDKIQAQAKRELEEKLENQKS